MVFAEIAVGCGSVEELESFVKPTGIPVSPLTTRDTTRYRRYFFQRCP